MDTKEAGRRGGLSRSEKKAAAARLNGRKPKRNRNGVPGWAQPHTARQIGQQQPEESGGGVLLFGGNRGERD